MGKALRDESDEELYNLDPHELSLTIAPMNKEDFLMTKAATTPEQFAEVLKALDLDPEDFDAATIEKAVDVENDRIKKAMPAALKEALERKQGKKKDTDKGVHDDEDEEDEEEEMKKAIKGMDDEARKSLVSVAAMLQPLAKSIPGINTILKALTQAKKDDPDKFEKEADAKKSSIEVFKSQYPDLVDEITKPLSDQLTKTNEVLAEITKSAALTEMRELAKDMPHLKGEPDEVAERLRVMKSELSDDNWDAFVVDQKSIGQVIAKSDAFKRVSSSTATGGTAIERIKIKSKEIRSKSAGKDLTEAEAMTEIIKNDPELYNKYLEEQRAGAAVAR